jgi:hypothetical protein
MRLHELQPWRSFVIETRWSPEVAITELQKRIDVPGFFDLGEGTAPFAGRRLKNKDAFGFSPRASAPGQANGFKPVVHAAVEPSHRDGARIRVTMRMQLFTMVFMMAWMGGATYGALTFLVRTLPDGNLAGVFALLLPMFGVFLYIRGFVLEARKSEHMLREIFASAPALPAPVDTGVAYR